jgi:hypothetical protein
LIAADAGRVVAATPPPWVTEWILKRDAGAQKKAAKAPDETAPSDPDAIANREAEREKRAARREDRVRAGLEDLQRWLSDLMRQGLAHAKQQPAQHFDAMAARMVDAQAPGMARRLRKFPSILAGGDDWADRALEEAGALQWLLHGYSHLGALSEGLRASVRNAIGWTMTEQELAGVEAVRDRWQVVGQVMEEEDRLRVQRTWLFGESTGRAALCLSFAAANQPLDVTLVPGMVVDAELVFYLSASPLRALVRTRHGEPRALGEPSASASFAEALDLSASLLAGDPWLERTPWLVRGCVPWPADEKWFLRDAMGAVVPMARGFAHAWPLFALSGGEPVTIFGEWNGRVLHPLSVVSADRFVSLGGALA